MPFVLKHEQTAEIATDTLINNYDLPYYGTKFWHDEASAVAEKEAYLTEKGVADPERWKVIEVEEMAMKLFNVKLKNNPSLRLYLDEKDQPYVQE